MPKKGKKGKETILLGPYDLVERRELKHYEIPAEDQAFLRWQEREVIRKWRERERDRGAGASSDS